MLVQGRKDQVRHIGILLSYEQVWCQCEKKVIEDGLERGQCHFMCLSIYMQRCMYVLYSMYTPLGQGDHVIAYSAGGRVDRAARGSAFSKQA